MTAHSLVVDGTDVKAVLAGQWGMTATEVEPLGGEYDTTLRVVDHEGTAHCVKIRHLEGDASGLDLELAALEHLRHHDPVDVPRIRSTLDGDDRWASDGRAVWVLSWLDGLRWADVAHHGPRLNRTLGEAARRLSRALESFDHPAAHRTHHWDLRSADQAIARHADQLSSERQRAIGHKALQLFADRVEPAIDRLPRSVVHQDLNDHNVIVSVGGGLSSVAGIVDFGDLLHSVTIAELAVPMAYAMLQTPYPLDCAAEVVSGWFDGESPTDDELAVLFPLALCRLVVNATTWSARMAHQPGYARLRSVNTWATLDRLLDLPMAFVDERIATACDRRLTAKDQPVFRPPAVSLHPDLTVVDLDPHCDVFDTVDPTDKAAVRAAALPELPHAIAHDTVRLDRGGPADGDGGPATIQLGLELHLPRGSEVRLPVDGTVVEATPERVVVSHRIGREELWSQWTGLHPLVKAGAQLVPGDPLGQVSDDAASPVSVQLLRFLPSQYDRVPSSVRPADRVAWAALSLDPSNLLGLTPVDPPTESVQTDIVALRDSRLASSQRYYYREPMNLVRASGVWFIDANGHHYLDAINNVTHVGHANERVVAAAHRQMRRLNTNSRFIYEEMAIYADRLARLLPDPLEVVFLVCTGSEANDLALRIARQVTGRTDIMVVDGAYHGNTTAVTGISPNRYRGPGGDGPPSTTHEVTQPNRYRGPFGYDDPEAGTGYAESVRNLTDRLVSGGRPPAAFIAESLMGTAGQIVYPDGYLNQAFAAVRSVGGLCISDEVQVGFGRLGNRFWGFELGEVVPDIVTMGKPMGNGHPIAAVVTTRAIADAFDRGMKYFNTFGGNPVSCAVAGAVLDEIEDRGLQDHALHTGTRFRSKLRELADHDDRIGDVRGEGLYLGVEFVRDRVTKEPAGAFTSKVSERMRERGVIVYPNGVHGNCLKIKPPMIFTDRDTDRFTQTLADVLGEQR